MGVAQSEPICGEVFAAGEDVLFSHPTIKNARIVNNGLVIVSPAAATETVVFVREVV